MVPSVEVWLDGRDASPVGTARFNLRRGELYSFIGQGIPGMSVPRSSPSI